MMPQAKNTTPGKKEKKTFNPMIMPTLGHDWSPGPITRLHSGKGRHARRTTAILKRCAWLASAWVRRSLQPTRNNDAWEAAARAHHEWKDYCCFQQEACRNSLVLGVSALKILLSASDKMSARQNPGQIND